MAGYLSRRSCCHNVSRYVPPISLSIFLQTHQEQPGTPFFLSCSGGLTHDLRCFPPAPACKWVCLNLSSPIPQSMVKLGGDVLLLVLLVLLDSWIGINPASMLLTSSSNSLYFLMTSPDVFPGIMAATLCHLSGVSLSYTAKALSNFLFSSGVHLVIMFSSISQQLLFETER